MAKTSKPTAIYDVVSRSNSSLKSILQHIETINLLQSTVSQNLGLELAKHCTVINLNAGVLVIKSQHANWATRIRYKTSDILHAIQANPKLPTVNTIRVTTSPSNSINRSKTKNRISVSEKVSAELNAVAKTTTDDRLSDCLLRLSKHTKNEPPP